MANCCKYFTVDVLCHKNYNSTKIQFKYITSLALTDEVDPVEVEEETDTAFIHPC